MLLCLKKEKQIKLLYTSVLPPRAGSACCSTFLVHRPGSLLQTRACAAFGLSLLAHLARNVAGLAPRCNGGGKDT